MLCDVKARRIGPHAADDTRLALKTLDDLSMGHVARDNAATMLFFWVVKDEHLRTIIWDRLDILLDHAFDPHERMIAMRCMSILITLGQYADGNETSPLITTMLERGVIMFLFETARTHRLEPHLTVLTLMAMLAPYLTNTIDIEVMLDTVTVCLRNAHDTNQVLMCLTLLNDVTANSETHTKCLIEHRDVVKYLVHEGLHDPETSIACASVRVLTTISARRDATHAATIALVDAGIFEQLRVLFECTDWSNHTRRDAIRLMANIIADGEHVMPWIDSGLAASMPIPADTWAEFCELNHLPDDAFMRDASIIATEFKDDCIVCASNALYGTNSAAARDLMVNNGLWRHAVMGLTYEPTSEVFQICIDALVHVCRFQ